MTASRNTGDLDKSDRVHQLAPSIPFTDQLYNVIGGVVRGLQNRTGSDMIRVSQICDGKWLAEGGFSVTNLGKLDKIRHDQGWLAEG